MNISYNWIKEYLDVKLPAEEVANILTDIGLEVEHHHPTGIVEGHLDGLIVGKVVEVRKHPNADKLKIAEVSVGNESNLQIICGAPNLAGHQKVVVATVGAVIYPLNNEKIVIKKAKIRGEESFGMICAEDEIGIGESHDGIIVLSSEAKTGQPVIDHLAVEPDHIFEIGLTPNRNDAMSHIGVARDLAAALKINFQFTGKITLPSVDKFKPDTNDLKIEVELADPEGCPRYTGVTISGIEVKESPAWLKAKLQSIDVRPINNIVDATNFVLHEYGQPLHAFDVDEIAGNKIVVRTLPDGTKFKTLDEEERTLSSQDLMICDEKEGMCIAGVFGGIKSGVKETTTNIFIESAYFDPTSIRRTSTKHGIKSDAALRFEKGADPEITVIALKRAALLIKELAGGHISSDIVDLYPKKIKDTVLDLEFQYIDKLSGIKIDRKKITEILEALGIKVISVNSKSLKLRVPSFKADVKRGADIAEELIRIYGYNKIPIPKMQRSVLAHNETPDRDRIRNSTSDFLSSNGFFEIMGTSITNSKYYESFLNLKEGQMVPLVNYSTSDMDVMRPSMLFSGLEAVSYNLNRQQENLKLYEFGHTYENKGKQISETHHLSIFLTGLKSPESWASEKAIVDFHHLKAFVNNILRSLGIERFDVWKCENSSISEGLTYKYKKNVLAEFGELNSDILTGMDIKQPVFYADINWGMINDLVKEISIEFVSLQKFPAMRRDLALVVDQSVQFEDVEKVALQTEKKILREVNLFDIYSDEKLGKGKKSYAVSFIFQDESKTLTDLLVDKIMKKLVLNYEQQLKAEIRK